MVFTDGDVICETDEELLIFDVSDDALERVASIGVGLSVVSLNFGTPSWATAPAQYSKQRKQSGELRVTHGVPKGLSRTCTEPVSILLGKTR
jgi:hypothetical protein